MDQQQTWLVEALVAAAEMDDFQAAQQFLDRIDAMAADEPADRWTVEKLRLGLAELKRRSADPEVAFEGALTNIVARSQDETVDPLETLLAIDALAQRLEALHEYERACAVHEIALDLSRDIGDTESTAYVARLRRYAGALRTLARDAEAQQQERNARDVEELHANLELKPDRSQPRRERAEAAEDVFVDVFYATSRNATGDTNPYAAYGSERSLPHYGIATVSIPRQRDKGTLQFPTAWERRIGARSDACFLLTSLRAETKYEVWLQYIRQKIKEAGRNSTDTEALLFVHGYNTEFWQAMLRAGQLGADLEINGAISAYSWPSQGTTLGYRKDEEEVSFPNVSVLADLITEIAVAGQPQRLFLMAHSLGSRFLMRALELLNQRIANFKAAQAGTGKASDADVDPTALAALREIVFASPDMETDDFAGRIKQLTHMDKGITIYCSTKDDALWWGETLKHSYPRAGRSAMDLTKAGLVAVDTTQASGSDHGHGDYAASAISDILALFWFDLSPAQRSCLARVGSPGQSFWSYQGRYAKGAEQFAFQFGLIAARREGSLQKGLDWIEQRIAAKHRGDDQTALAMAQIELRAMIQLAPSRGAASHRTEVEEREFV
jgi:esterase/lipase superfamily enzyme